MSAHFSAQARRTSRLPYRGGKPHLRIAFHANGWTLAFLEQKDVWLAGVAQTVDVLCTGHDNSCRKALAAAEAARLFLIAEDIERLRPWWRRTCGIGDGDSEMRRLLNMLLKTNEEIVRWAHTPRGALRGLKPHQAITSRSGYEDVCRLLRLTYRESTST